MDIKVVWILSNYPFCRRTEGDSNNGKMSGGEIIDTVSTGPDIVYEYSPCSILMKILLNCDENFTQIYYGFYSILLANLLNSPVYTNRITLKFRQLKK